MKKKVLYSVYLLMGSLVAFGSEVEPVDDKGMVEMSRDEVIRLKLNEKLGKPDQYDYILIFPQEELWFIGVLMDKPENNGAEIRIWRADFGTDGREVSHIQGEKFAQLKVGLEDIFQKIGMGDNNLDYPSRIFIYRKIKNVDVTDWQVVSVEWGSNKLVNLDKLLGFLWTRKE